MKKLSVSQARAISLLIEGKTRKQVAKELSITPQTLSEWNKNPEFERALKVLKNQMLDEAKEIMMCTSYRALETLTTLMNESKSDEIKRKVALDILELTGLKRKLILSSL